MRIRFERADLTSSSPESASVPDGCSRGFSPGGPPLCRRSVRLPSTGFNALSAHRVTFNAAFRLHWLYGVRRRRQPAPATRPTSDLNQLACGQAWCGTSTNPDQGWHGSAQPSTGRFALARRRCFEAQADIFKTFSAFTRAVPLPPSTVAVPLLCVPAIAPPTSMPSAESIDLTRSAPSRSLGSQLEKSLNRGESSWSSVGIRRCAHLKEQFQILIRLAILKTNQRREEPHDIFFGAQDALR